MPLLIGHVRAVLVAVLSATVALPFALSAQAARSGAPVEGTWGAEASVGSLEGAALLRFLSPRWAVVASASVSSREGFLGSSGDRSTFTSLRVGARRYARTGLGVRPLVGFGLTLSDGPGSFSAVGGYGELGAVYFFNPHVSLGGSGDISITWPDGGGTNFNISIARLTGAVYF